VRAVVVGARGQLGTDLVRVLHAAGHATTAVTRADLDVTDQESVERFIRAWAEGQSSALNLGPVGGDSEQNSPRWGGERAVLFNCAAYTDVDGAESDEAAAFVANAVGPAHLATACAKHDVELVHVSTDYVFAGDAERPYEVDDPTGPRTAYGRTKLAGEQAVFDLAPRSYVVRTAWVYGATGRNFIKTMARLERERETIAVVDDQRGSPTWAGDLARGLVALAGSGRHGRYHCSNGGETTWWGLARATFEELGADPARVLPCSTADFPRPAARPAYSVLSDRSWRVAGLEPLPHWRVALATAFAQVGDELRGG
jgi:dTDP-4-dehydrorhamnose reductase